MEVDEIRDVTQLVLNQVSHWNQARWKGRSDAFYAALQRIAGPEHELPRLSDSALPDQLRVLVADLLDNNPGPAEISRALVELTAIRGALTAAQ